MPSKPEDRMVIDIGSGTKELLKKYHIPGSFIARECLNFEIDTYERCLTNVTECELSQLRGMSDKEVHKERFRVQTEYLKAKFAAMNAMNDSLKALRDLKVFDDEIARREKEAKHDRK